MSTPLFPSDYAFRDIYLLASATEDEPDTDERAIHGLGFQIVSNYNAHLSCGAILSVIYLKKHTRMDLYALR